jgi:Flp pilus assembly pilin Flp
MSFIKDEAGATAIEYGVFIGFWGMVLVSAMTAFTTSSNGSIYYIVEVLSAA